MIKIQNTVTGQIVNVSNVVISDGRLIARKESAHKTPRFFRSYPMIKLVGKTDEETPRDIFELCEDWVIAKGERKPAPVSPEPETETTPAPETSPEPETEAPVTETTPEPAPVDEEPIVVTETTQEPTPETSPEPAPAPIDVEIIDVATETAKTEIYVAKDEAEREAIKRDLLERYGIMGAEIFEAASSWVTRNRKTIEEENKRMAAIVHEIFAKYAEQKPEVAKFVAKEAKKKIEKKDEIHCREFKDIKQDVELGYYPYLYGAAGCGKSHTAEQIANDLGLDFYPQTTIQFAHDVRGYGDAAGRFVETSFYKAFAHGGLYFQDEYDRSVPEAAIVLNTALANGCYDFPVVGRVYAHPNFRFMAAGNTRLKGGDSQYIGTPMDASNRDRVIEYEMSYDRRVELKIAGNNTVLVDFIEDVRQAIAATNIEQVVSYRATKYASVLEEAGRSLDKILKRKVFATLESDEIRVIYGALKDKNNPWAKAMKTLF